MWLRLAESAVKFHQWGILRVRPLKANSYWEFVRKSRADLAGLPVWFQRPSRTCCTGPTQLIASVTCSLANVVAARRVVGRSEGRRGGRVAGAANRARNRLGPPLSALLGHVE